MGGHRGSSQARWFQVWVRPISCEGRKPPEVCGGCQDAGGTAFLGRRDPVCRTVEVERTGDDVATTKGFSIIGKTDWEGLWTHTVKDHIHEFMPHE